MTNKKKLEVIVECMTCHRVRDDDCTSGPRWIERNESPYYVYYKMMKMISPGYCLKCWETEKKKHGSE